MSLQKKDATEDSAAADDLYTTRIFGVDLAVLMQRQKRNAQKRKLEKKLLEVQQQLLEVGAVGTLYDNNRLSTSIGNNNEEDISKITVPLIVKRAIDFLIIHGNTFFQVKMHLFLLFGHLFVYA